MTEAKRAALKRLIERHTQVVTASRAAAKASLVRDGIYTADERLRPEYRVGSNDLAAKA